VGVIISGFGSFRTNLTISEGQTLDVPRADFFLKLEKFETELYPNGSVKDWKSTLTVIEAQKSVLNKTIEVNHPLSYKGFVFYQSSYGWDWKNPSLEIAVKKRQNPSSIRTMILNVGETIPLEDSIEMTVIHFVPDFMINDNKEITTRSLEPKNPAAFISGRRANEEVFSGWIFHRYPDFNRIHSQKENDYVFELKNFKKSQYSGIQMAKDPGVNFIWIGCSILMIGLFVAFFWPPREIKLILEENDGKIDVTAGGVASKNKEDFQKEFERLMELFRRA
jgi:cytochrome c biogenesis protein